jgi:hypothetical protein
MLYHSGRRFFFFLPFSPAALGFFSFENNASSLGLLLRQPWASSPSLEQALKDML